MIQMPDKAFVIKYHTALNGLYFEILARWQWADTESGNRVQGV